MVKDLPSLLDLKLIMEKRYGTFCLYDPYRNSIVIYNEYTGDMMSEHCVHMKYLFSPSSGMINMFRVHDGVSKSWDLNIRDTDFWHQVDDVIWECLKISPQIEVEGAKRTESKWDFI